MPPNQATVDAVRERADLVELVRDRVDLTRRGGRWWGRCPFHEERSPSFSLLPPDFRRYYCHGCHVSGDAIDWAQAQGGAGGFYEAIEQLAERFGIPVEYRDEDPAAKARRAAEKAREDLLDRAATFFARVLWQAREAEPARRYLTERGFEQPLIERFRVGYAPASGTALATKALAEGFSSRPDGQRRPRPAARPDGHRLLLRPDHVPDRRRPGPGPGLRRPHPRPGGARQVRQLARGAELPEADAAVRARRGPRRGRAVPSISWCARATPT